jgi:uncharacterized protein (DUF362 family)
MNTNVQRREFLAGLGASGLSVCQPKLLRAAAPTAPVAVAKCKTYGAEFLPALAKMFDQIGGLGRLVKNKTVAIKINMTGDTWQRLGYLPAGITHFTHPTTIGATIHLLNKAGARRIRILEGPIAWQESLEEAMYRTGWDVSTMSSAAPRVDYVNTNLPYPGKKPYARFPVPNGGHLFPAYDLNTAYEECDVMVSLTKIKEHQTAGITLTIKNFFGITPCTIYGERAGVDEPSPVPYGGRGSVMHNGSRQPSKSAPSEKDPKSPRQAGYRVPRSSADLIAARPVQLTILDAIESMAGGEGPWIRGTRPASPGFMVVGANAVTADAVTAAIMGFDPMADRGTAPFETCDSILRLAEELGVGTRDLKRIEVVGTPIREALFSFRAVPGGLPPQTAGPRAG